MKSTTKATAAELARALVAEARAALRELDLARWQIRITLEPREPRRP